MFWGQEIETAIILVTEKSTHNLYKKLHFA